ncbi:hypothetical protein ACFFRR_000973 [Megaselia abdita]
MEGNLTDMDYAYGGPPSFPIWKPHYFPRGEAPPPYEEAIAISQAEQLSMVTAAAEQVQHYQIQSQPPHVSSTTNLINININSGGNITATAINHQTPEQHFNSTNTHQPSQLGSCHAQEYTQTPSRLQIASNAICLQTGTPLNSIVHQASQQQQYIPISVSTVSTIPSSIVECNYKNCYLNNSQKRVQQQQQPKIQIQALSQSQIHPRDPKVICEESQSLVRRSPEDCALNKTPITRRNFRSIPKHLSISNDTSSAETQTSLVNNVKSSCQCPVQHTPMYMGSNRVHSSSNIIHQSSIAKTPKSVKSTSTSTAGLKNNVSINSKITTISKQVGDTEEITKPMFLPKSRGTDPIASTSKSTLIQLTESHPTLPPKLCKANLQKRSNSFHKSNLSNKMTLKSHASTPKMEFNIPVDASYSGLVNIEKNRNNVSQAKSYMLSKHPNSKTSIIDDVVSKVPSVITLPSNASRSVIEPSNLKMNFNPSSNANLNKCATLPKLMKMSNKVLPNSTFKEHALKPHENSLEDEYFSECENCKTAQSTKYLIGTETLRNEMETMTLQRKTTTFEKENDQQFRTSCTLPSNSKKNGGATSINRKPWFSTVSATSDEEDIEAKD